MTARVRIEPKLTIKTLAEAEDVLRQIGVIERYLAMVEASANDDIDRIKKQAAADVATIAEPLPGLVEALNRYALEHKAELGKKRAWKTTFGDFGFRFSKRLEFVGRGTEEGAARLAQTTGWHHLVKETVKIDKTALAKEDDAVINQLGYQISPVESFGYTIDKARIAELPK